MCITNVTYRKMYTLGEAWTHEKFNKILNKTIAQKGRSYPLRRLEQTVGMLQAGFRFRID